MNEKGKKIAFVCQRYGLEVNGGAELYCRQIAEKLSEQYDVTVYTTCAVEYTTWENQYTPGTDWINGVKVKRYPVKRERESEKFKKISQIVMRPNHLNLREKEWVEKQGPFSPDAIAAIKSEHKQYCVVFFVTYLYYLTVKGITVVDNAVLIPTLHDEPWVYLGIYDKVFANTKAVIWLTEEERKFAYKRFPFLYGVNEEMTGIGIDSHENDSDMLPVQIHDLNYVVYAGRIDESKGCKEMFDFFLKYKRRHPDNLKLVLVGKEILPVPKNEDIISLGYVSEEVKYSVLKNAFALLLFSRFESLSMVVLESMMMGRPVLVTEYCEVLKGHCVKSNAGLFFGHYYEFEAALDYLRSHPDQYEVMRANGKEYVHENYRWDVIIAKYRNMIEKVAGTGTSRSHF